MANETMRIFFQMKIVTYEDAILAAIAKENCLFENA